MSKPKSPPAPDYAGLAQQQGQENRDTAGYNTNLGRANQSTPWGNLSWSTRPGADPNNPQAGDWTQTVSLSPEQQSLLDQQNRISASLGNTAESGLGRVDATMGTKFDTSGIPQTEYLGGFQQNARADNSYLNGLRGIPSAADDASRQRVEQAMMSRLDPQFQRDEQSMRTQLANSGISPGTEAWDREMSRLDQSRNDARMQSVLAGGQEESRQVGLNAGLQQQDYAQRSGAQAQQFGQQQSIDQMVNALQQQYAGFNNQSRQNDLQSRAWERQLPLNELNSLRTGAQVQGPRFDPYYTGTAQAAPTFDAGVAQGNYDMASWQNQMGGYNGMMGGLGNLGSAAIMKWSDARLKSNIRRVGQHSSGAGLYEWTWADGTPDRGFIAQELRAHRPEAVGEFCGYLTVDMGLMGEV